MVSVTKQRVRRNHACNLSRAGQNSDITRHRYPALAPSEDAYPTMNEQEMIQQKLAELRTEHRDLDDVIARIAETAPYDQLQIQRLKKRKLMLKDQITRLESRMLPDIIA